MVPVPFSRNQKAFAGSTRESLDISRRSHTDMTAAFGDPLCQLPTISMKSLIHCTLPSAQADIDAVGVPTLALDLIHGGPIAGASVVPAVHPHLLHF